MACGAVAEVGGVGPGSLTAVTRSGTCVPCASGQLDWVTVPAPKVWVPGPAGTAGRVPITFAGTATGPMGGLPAVAAFGPAAIVAVPAGVTGTDAGDTAGRRTVAVIVVPTNEFMPWPAVADATVAVIPVPSCCGDGVPEFCARVAGSCPGSRPRSAICGNLPLIVAICS